MKRVEIFKVGTHRAMDGTEAAYGERELRVAAAAYDPAIYKAPIVIGHPEMDAPAYGWVEALEFAGGTLGAWVDQLAPEFEAAVAQGHYRNVSAAFWPADAPGNPKPGVLYLRHVGFLGAAAPAVKGLGVVNFAAKPAAGAVCYADGGGVAAFAEAPAVPGGAADLARRAERIERAELRMFCDRLVAEGRLLPVMRGMAETLILTAPAKGVVAFAEADGGEAAGPREAIMRFLERLPKVVPFGEFAPAGGWRDGAGDGAAAPSDFALPAGWRADPAREALLAEAERIVARDRVSFAEAVRRADAAGGRTGG